MSARAGLAGSVAAALYAAAIYGFILLPVLVLVLFSFQDGRFPIPPFEGFSLRWYREVVADRRLTAALANSAILAVVSSAVAVLLGFLAAYGHARFRVPAGAVQRGLLLAPVAVSYLIIGMGLLISFNALGVQKTLWTAGIGHVVINMPLCFAIIYSQMGAHQANIERAARDLGAREWQVLLLITAPLVWPALFASFFLAMTFSWDEFIIAFLLTRFEVTLPVEIWNMLRSGLNPKTNAAGSLVFGVSVLIALLLELVVLRRRGRG
jgi:spermidine/putrescine transport system permease protein